MPDGDEGLPTVARTAVVFVLLAILGAFVLTVAIGSLLHDEFEIESLVVLGVVPVLSGAILLAMGIKLPDWWGRR